MTEPEMEATMQSDVIKYIGSSTGGLLHNKLYTIKEKKFGSLDLHMPKGQTILVSVKEHDRWEMHEAKGADEAKKRRLKSLTDDFYNLLDANWMLDDINMTAIDMEDLMKDFPLDAKMKLLGKLSKDQLELLDFFHKITKHKLTMAGLIKAFKRGKHEA